MTHGPAFWNVTMAEAVPWQEAYKAVEMAARDKLAGIERTLTTNELVEELYPEQFAREAGITARKRIYKALAALATRGLADCASRGEPRKLRHAKKLVRPWLWHAPTVELNPEAVAANTVRQCPHCGGIIT